MTWIGQSMGTLNSPMLTLLSSSICREARLDRSLNELLDEGFTCVDGCYLLTGLAKVRTQYGLAEFQDRTAYECFINGVHIDDYVDEEYIAQTFLFVTAVMKAWIETTTESTLEVIVSKTNHGYNVKLHVVRSGEDYIDHAEIDNFEEAVLVVRS